MGRPAELKASFVVPVFNGQAYIAQAIQSCLNQTVRGIEVVVVNDGSTDNTERIVNAMAAQDKRVKQIVQENKGRCVARNVGNLAASAPIVFVLDADDIALPNRVADCLALWKKDPGIDLMYGKFQAINAIGDILGLSDAKPFDINKVKETGFAYIGHSTLCYKKSVLEKVSYTDGDWSKHAIDDWKFQIDAYKAGFRFGVSNKILSQYRIIPKERDEAKIKELKTECLNAA